MLGLPEIDSQHKKLLELINTLCTVLKQGEQYYLKNREKILSEIIDYTIYHFGAEEKLFALIGYSMSDFHVSQHNAFISEVARQVDNIALQDFEHGQKLYQYLSSWVLNHILKSDRAFCMYARTQLTPAEI